MTLQMWSNDYSVNHPIMDSDHQKMLGMINNLFNAMKLGQSKDMVRALLDSLNQYAMDHFAREEKYLMENNNPDREMQMQQHKLFMNKVDELKKGYESGELVAVKMLPFLNEWFVNHIMVVDMKYKK